MNRLLILDDDETFAERLKRSISGFSKYKTVQLEVANTPLAAIDLARNAAEKHQPFNTLLIDQNLDESMDGIQTMIELLKIDSDADTIIFTGFDTPEDGLRAYRAGASRYLPKPFKAEELEFVLEELERSRKVRQEEARQRKQFEIAAKITEAVGANLDLESTMDAVLGTLCKLFENTRVCVLLYEKNQRSLEFAPATVKYYSIENQEYSQQYRFPLDGKSIACRTARKALISGEWVLEYVEDVLSDDDYLNLNSNTRSECCVGLLGSKGNLLGILVLERDRLYGFDESDLGMSKMAARHIGIAIERAKQSEDLEYNSTVALRTSWVAALTHDIGNMVGNILNWTYFIRKLAPENQKIQEYAKNIEENVAQMSASNPWGNQPPKRVEIDAMVESNVRQMTSLRSIEVVFSLGAPETQVSIRVVQFQHVLKHLLNNADQAMMEKPEKRIYISTWLTDDKQVNIMFKDSGEGISEEQHLSAFKRRFTTKETGGYGLLFVRQMIEEMNGEITLLPYKEGEGATFLIRLPICKSNQSQGG